MKLYDPVFILRTSLLVVLAVAALAGTSLTLLDWGLHQVTPSKYTSTRFADLAPTQAFKTYLKIEFKYDFAGSAGDCEDGGGNVTMQKYTLKKYFEDFGLVLLV